MNIITIKTRIIKNGYQFFNSFPAFALFLAPALTAIGVFLFVPVVAAFALSFSDIDIYALGNLSVARFVGLRNYVQLLEDPLFWQSVWNTL